MCHFRCVIKIYLLYNSKFNAVGGTAWLHCHIIFFVVCGLLFLIFIIILFILSLQFLVLSCFRSELKLTPENVYGKQMENGSWDGVMGMMARGEVDATSVELTMEPMRSEAVDYIAPLINDRFVYYYYVFL